MCLIRFIPNGLTLAEIDGLWSKRQLHNIGQRQQFSTQDVLLEQLDLQMKFRISCSNKTEAAPNTLLRSVSPEAPESHDSLIANVNSIITLRI